MMDFKEQYDELVKQAKYHNDRYYNQDNPEISDYEYDMLMQQIKALEKEHPELITADSPTQRVGGTALTTFEKYQHPVPLMSLQDVFSLDELNVLIHGTQKLEP